MAKTKPADEKPPLPPGVPPDGAVVGTPDEKPPPPFGTARAADPGGPLPRVVDQLERSPGGGVVRFKIACRNYSPRKVRYVLARGEDEAVACYLAAEGLDRELDRLKKLAGPRADEVEPPAIVVTRLPD